MKIVTYFIVLAIFQICVMNCAENSVNVNIKNVVNSIDDKFISISTDFLELYENYLVNLQNGAQYFEKWADFSPSYIRLERLETFLIRYNEFTDKINKTNLSEFFGMLNSYQLTPVVVLNYDPVTFKPLQKLNIFQLALSLNIKNCVWQLGSNNLDFTDEKNVMKYSEDLRTLKIICDTAMSEIPEVNWNVASVGGYLKKIYDESMELLDVAGYEWKDFTVSQKSNKNSLLMDKDASLLNKISEPVWINIKTLPFNKSSTPSNDNSKSQIFTMKDSCDHVCLSDGLLFAQIVGDAARDGYNGVFFSESFKNSNSILPNIKHTKSNFKNVVMTFHKNLVGRKVFNLKLMKIPFGGKSNVQMYGYCSKQMNGGMTFMGINYSSNRGKFNLKGLNSATQNIVALQYLLSVTDGQVLLNNEKLTKLDTITPAYKFKKSGKNSLILTLPPFSVGFWTLKNLKNMECFNYDESGPQSSHEQESMMSSSDSLLKHLLKGIFSQNEVEKRSLNDNEDVPINSQFVSLVEQDHGLDAAQKVRKLRVKRQYLPGPFDFLNFDLPEFPTLPPFQSSMGRISQIPTISPVASSQAKQTDMFNGQAKESIPDIYKLTEAENIFKSSENTNMPYEDVHMSLGVGAGKDFSTQDATVEVKKPKAKKPGSSQKQKAQQHQFQMLPASKETYIPHDYLEAYSKTNFKNEKRSNVKPKIAELHEAEQVATYANNKNDQSVSSSNNVELKMVVKELEPTYKQSRLALMAAKKKLENMKIMEIMENGDLKEISKDEINPSDMLKMIDLTEDDFDSVKSSEEFDDGDEEFFREEEKQRNKRDLMEKNYMRLNEVLDDNDDHDYYFDVESLDNAVDEIVRPPSYQLKIDVLNDRRETTQASETTTEVVIDQADTVDSGLTAKAVNYFGKSMKDVVSVFQKSFMGWWTLFTQT